MKTLKLELPYKLSEEEAKMFNNKQTTIFYIKLAVEIKYKDGLTGSQRRLWSRLQEKLTDNADSVELEDDEFEFVRKAFSDEVRLPVVFADNITLLEKENLFK